MSPYMFLFLNVILVASTEARKSLEERYIDLLPEKDKMEFFGKVERRIHQDVNTNIKPDKPDLVLEDEDVEFHSEYVNKVLKEEAIKFVNEKDTRRALNESSNDNSRMEQNADMIDKITTSEDLTLREKGRQEETTSKSLIEHEAESISNNSDKVVTSSNIDAHYVDNINITTTVTDLLLTKNKETTASETLVTSTIKDITQNVDEFKVDEGIPKQNIQRIHTNINVLPQEVNVYETKLNNPNDYLSNKDQTIYSEDKVSKKKDLSQSYSKVNNCNSKENYFEHTSTEGKRYDVSRNSQGHEVYEMDPNDSQSERKETVVYYPHQEKSKTLNEEPYYIPVYNYDVHNVFYNAKNRLGPNDDNVENADQYFENDKQYQRDGEKYNLNFDYKVDFPKVNKYNQNPYLTYNNNEKNPKKLTELSAKRITTSKKPIYDNDKFDIDYYFGRNVEKEEEEIDNEEEKNENEEENVSEEAEENMKSKILSGRFKVIGNGKGVHQVDSVVPEEDALTMKTKDEKVLIFTKVINDMIRVDSDVLLKYDWLGTTIDILAATDKLNTVLREDRLGLKLNSQDKQLLGYIQYLYENAKHPESSSNIDEDNKDFVNFYINKRDSKHDRLNDQRKIPKFLIDVAKVYAKLSLTEDTDEVFPKNWKDVTERDLSDVVSSDIKHFARNIQKDLESFFSDVEVKLYGLHITIKDIAINTKYKDQNWFNDIKKKYLRILTREKSLQVLLHIMSAALLDAIEDSAGKGVEFDFQKYIRENKKEVKRTIQRFKVVITLLDELNA